MPTLASIQAMVANSDPEDWAQLEPGPTYLYQLWTVSDRDGTHLEPAEHITRAVYRSNVELGLAWGLVRDTPSEAKFPWTGVFPDAKHDRLVFVDILWNGAPVDRLVVAVVDGGRAVLPPARPIVVDAGFGDAEIVGEVATPYDVAVARLIHTLSGSPESEFDRYSREAGIVEVPDDGPRR
jgi:hypothetical protein